MQCKINHIKHLACVFMLYKCKMYIIVLYIRHTLGTLVFLRIQTSRRRLPNHWLSFQTLQGHRSHQAFDPLDITFAGLVHRMASYRSPGLQQRQRTSKSIKKNLIAFAHQDLPITSVWWFYHFNSSTFHLDDSQIHGRFPFTEFTAIKSHKHRIVMCSVVEIFFSSSTEIKVYHHTDFGGQTLFLELCSNLCWAHSDAGGCCAPTDY